MYLICVFFGLGDAMVSLWASELVELKMLDISDRTRAGFSILTSVSDCLEVRLFSIDSDLEQLDRIINNSKASKAPDQRFFTT